MGRGWDGSLIEGGSVTKFLLLFLLASPAAAQNVLLPGQAMQVSDAFKSTATCAGVQVSSAVYLGSQSTAILLSTQTAWSSVYIQNLSTFTNIYCSPSIWVSSNTTPIVNNIGLFIAGTSPPTGASVPLFPGQQEYCVNDGALGKTTIVRCPGR